jgi:TRAP-type mannitol/chloroaromatic compound transport system substrate-binding protein
MADEAGFQHGQSYYWVGPADGEYSLYTVSPIFSTPEEAKAWQVQNGSNATAAKTGGMLL